MANESGILGGDNAYRGGISFSTAALTLGAQNGAQINGGFNFDLPLSTVAMFTQNAMDFAGKNSRNAQGFLGGVIDRTQSNVTQTSQSALDFMTIGMQSLQGINATNQLGANYRSTVYKPPKAGGGGCFITTAICDARELPDDCEELEVLRKFRDTYMLASCKGRNLVRRYYEIAPQIAARLSYEQCEFLRREYLLPAIDAIKHGHFEKAKLTYSLMVVAAEEMTGV